MGGGHGDPFKIPDYKIYSNYRAYPQLDAHERRLARLGLKDPWIRNYVYLCDKRYPHNQSFLKNIWGLVKIGVKPGLIAAVLFVTCEEAYSKLKHGHTSWAKPAH